jgi:GlcNAc-P-P-Und epimerase
MKILITGGNGFIGSYLRKDFQKKDMIVKTLGRGKGNDYQVDLSEESIEIKEQFDMIIHTASIVHNHNHSGGLSVINILKDNAISQNFLSSIQKVNFAKLIFLSSVAVYGKMSGENISIQEILNPKDGYGLSKILSERIYQNFIPESKILILRLPLVNGPNPKGNILKALKSIQANRMYLFKRNTAKKSILELEDLSNFIITKGMFLYGLHQIKSYDIYFNNFLKTLTGQKIKEVPYFSLYLLLSISSFFGFKNLKSTLIKASSTLTFKETIKLND